MLEGWHDAMLVVDKQTGGIMVQMVLRGLRMSGEGQSARVIVPRGVIQHSMA